MSYVDEIRYQPFPVLDGGSVTLVDCMGDDAAICEAARISYGKGTRRVSEDRDLIRYLMRHHHMSPFEMAEIKFAIRAPMDVWRQMVRHRAASLAGEASMWDEPSVNEYSTRYSEAIDAAQKTEPDAWRLQAKDNKQGSAGSVKEWPDGAVPSGITGQPAFESAGHYLTAMEGYLHHKARAIYEERLRFGVAREQARKDLPLSTYTTAYWCCDLRNVLHFLALRLDPHAQLEIRSYADTIAGIVARLFPLCWGAFVRYQLHAMTLSDLDQEVIRAVASGHPVEGALVMIANRRERDECRAKLQGLGLIRAVPQPKESSTAP